MKVELRLRDGRRWMRLTRKGDAIEAGLLSRTLMGGAFLAEHRRRRFPGEMRKPDFYLLVAADGSRADAAARVSHDGRLSGGSLVRDGSATVGYRNADPYPEHEEAIAALADHVRVPLPPESFLRLHAADR